MRVAVHVGADLDYRAENYRVKDRNTEDNVQGLGATAQSPVPSSDKGGADEGSRTVVDSWFTPGRFALLLVGIIVARFPRVVFGKETFFYRDYGLFTYPVAHYFRECFWHGQLPLWNPFNNFGVPLLAQWNTSIFYLPSLFFLLFPLTWALAVFNLMHLAFAGFGMYFLARRWTGSQLAASVAGMAFAFNGLSLHMLMWISNLAAWAWMPWVVLAVEKSWTGSRRALGLAAFAGAMQMLAGAPEIIILTWLVLGFAWLGAFWRGTVPRKRLFGRLAVVCLLIAGIAAAQLLPFLQLLAHSQRDTSYGDSKWSMPGWGWANFFVPLFRCSPSLDGIFSQDEQQWTSSYYMGIGVVALAMLAFWRARQPRVRWLIVAALGAVILSMGDNAHVYPWLKRAFPLLGVMRYPIKIVVLTTFALPLLAAFGLMPDKSCSTAGVQKAGLRLGTVGLFLLLVITGILLYAQQNLLPHESWAVTRESGVTRLIFLVLVLCAAWMVQTARADRTTGLAGATVLLLLALDALTHAPTQNPTLPTSIYEPLGTREKVTARWGESRAALDPRLHSFLLFAATPDPMKSYLGLRRALFLNCNLLDDIPTATGFFSLELGDSAQVGSILNSTARPFPEPLGDFLGVSQISSADTSFTWTNRPHFMPLVTGGQKPVFAGRKETLQAIASPEFNPRTTVYLDPTVRDLVQAGNQTAPLIIGSKFSAQQVEWETKSDVPALVVVAQSFYPAWHAYVDGKRVPLFEANGAFQALQVPAGRHHLKVAYEDRFFEYGAVISCLSLLVTGMVWIWGYRDEFDQAKEIDRAQIN